MITAKDKFEQEQQIYYESLKELEEKNFKSNKQLIIKNKSHE